MAANSQSANALAMVQEMQSYGMTMVSVINKSYQTIGASAQDAVASAWERTTDVIDEKTGAKTGTTTKTVNENQELANDWSKAKEFCFFKKPFKIQYWADKIKQRDIVSGKEVEVCPVMAGIEKTDDAAKMLIFCASFNDCWVIAMTNKSGGSLLAKKKKKDKKKVSGYASVQVMVGKLGKWIEDKEEDD